MNGLETMRYEQRRRVGRAGFTLVEMMMAVVITGIVGTAIVTLLLRQNKFYGQNDDLVYARQSIRAAVDLISSEIRMASPSDIVAATSDSLTIRFDLQRGVVCGSDPSSGDATVYVFDVVSNANISAVSGIAWSGPYDSAFVYDDGWNPTPSQTGSTPRATCGAAGAPTTGPDNVYQVVDNWSGQTFKKLTSPTATYSGSDAVPPRGALVRQYGTLTYRFGASSYTSGIAVWRNQQELVSPFKSGANFHYVLSDGTVTSAPSASQLSEIVKVRMSAVATGDGKNPYDVDQSIAYEIPLRN